MITSKFPGLLIALTMVISVSGCAPAYHEGNHYGNSYGHRHYSPPRPAPQPYGGNYGYGRPGW